MLKINIVAIGKIKEKYISLGIEEFSKRLIPYVNFNIIELNEAQDSEKSYIKDSETILKYLTKNNNIYTILLDVNSKEIDSVQLANLISTTSLNYSEINFVIGGSRGFDDRLRKYCNLRLSFSKLTFPHQLFRLILCEQIYRAITINNNIKYHK